MTEHDPPTIAYRLPMSCIRLTGTSTTKTDRVLDRTTRERNGAAELAVIADPEHELSITLDAGSFRRTKASFRQTVDGRLTAASATVTGEGGAALTGLIGIVSTALGAIALIAAAEPEASDDEKIDQAYVLENSDSAAARQAAREVVKKLRSAHRLALSDMAAATSQADRTQALKLANQLQAGLAQAEQMLDESEALFKAWRAGTIDSANVSYAQEITMDELRRSDASLDQDSRLSFPNPSGSPADQASVRQAQEKVLTAWEQLGCLVLIEGDPPHVEKRGSIPPEGSNMALWLAFPRQVMLRFYVRDKEDKAQLQKVQSVLIVDGESRVKRLDVHAGWFGENSGGVTFSDDGIPLGFEFGSSSAAAAALSALGAAPATVASSLEAVGKISDQLNALTNKGLEQTLARTKAQTELKQQELTSAGLAATTTDYAELESLKQQADLLEKRKALGLITTSEDPVLTQIATLRNQVILARLQRALDRMGE